MTARSFLLDWFALWRDETGHRRALEEARTRYLTWSTDPTYAQVPALQSIQAKMSLSFFDRLSPFLRDPAWEATNNGAERMGRLFRHDQAPHFNRRTTDSIEEAIVVRAIHRRDTKAYWHLSPIAPHEGGTGLSLHPWRWLLRESFWASLQTSITQSRDVRPECTGVMAQLLRSRYGVGRAGHLLLLRSKCCPWYPGDYLRGG